MGQFELKFQQISGYFELYLSEFLRVFEANFITILRIPVLGFW